MYASRPRAAPGTTRVTGASVGTTDPRFAPVADLLGEHVRADARGFGAAVAAYVDGRCVLDAWAGEAAPGRPWTAATRAVVWSVTKGVAAAGVQRLHERGAIDIEAAVAAAWPEFAAAGKRDILIRDVLAHTAGLVWWEGHERSARIEDAVGWDRPREIAAALAAAAPTLSPRTVGAYHNLTFGWLLNEILLRTTGRDAGAVVADELCRPLQLERLALGGTADDLAPLRLAQAADHPAARELCMRLSPGTPRGRAMLVTTSGGILAAIPATSHPRFRAAPQPACNAVADARSIARLYGALANGGVLEGRRHFAPGSIDQFTAVAWSGRDGITGDPIARGLGYQLHADGAAAFAPDPSAFGHPGWGGSVGFGLPAARLGFAYVTNRIDVADERARANALAAELLAQL
jgi:CubicO group peptidase (beta-lactamase class C family)